jgi:L-methionine (R)-S-oxide reductase
MKNTKTSDIGDSLLNELNAHLVGFWLTDLANFSAFFYQRIPAINWIGFYLSDGERLRLGPFSGKPACVEIAFNRGVCGATFTQRRRQIVTDVHSFPGHITCDADSRSELVLPFYVKSELVGVLDVDSPVLGRFSEADAEFFARALALISNLELPALSFSASGGTSGTGGTGRTGGRGI